MALPDPTRTSYQAAYNTSPFSTFRFYAPFTPSPCHDPRLLPHLPADLGRGFSVFGIALVKAIAFLNGFVALPLLAVPQLPCRRQQHRPLGFRPSFDSLDKFPALVPCSCPSVD